MTLFQAIENIILAPITMLIELVFSLANRFNNPALSIIALSIVINILVLPLYRRADDIQKEEQDTEKKLEYWVKHIRKTFKGDERFMMLQTYYRQNNYSPIFALKGVLPLALEIPFFIAAYQYLSNLSLLHGVSFGLIKDLGKPDSMLILNGISINVLPILMTVINIISGMIYTQGASLKNKAQLYLMAIVFLVLLYSSPSGLVLYWTCNNIFSLIKNILNKIPKSSDIISILMSLSGICIYFLTNKITNINSKKGIFLISVAIIMQIPLALSALKSKWKNEKSKSQIKSIALFFLCTIYMTLLLGLMIPSSVLVASPTEFINTLERNNPIWYVVNSLLKAGGMFILWLGIFRLLSHNSKIDKILLTLCIVCTINYFAYGHDKGTMSSLLVYDNFPFYNINQKLANLLLDIAVIIICYIMFDKEKMIKMLVCTGIFAILTISLINISKSYYDIKESNTIMSDMHDTFPQLRLSKKGKNVVLIMLDRGLSSFVPCIMEEKPELADSYSGFTFYPNCLSHGGCTNIGTPGLFGGYEYVPWEMNKRDNELLSEKHNEAIRVLPMLFGENGYNVSIFDIAYAGNYTYSPDYSVFNDVPNSHAYITAGKYADMKSEDTIKERNFFWYSIYRTVPLIMNETIYNGGMYNNTQQGIIGTQEVEGLSVSHYISSPFIKWYSAIENMINFTTFDENENGDYVTFVNETPHRPALLSEPEYLPMDYVDNTEYDKTHEERFSFSHIPIKIDNSTQMEHYHANMATFISLAKWLDYLKDNEVYDNTRIIIVSDHGFDLYITDRMLLDSSEDGMRYNALLMVKDFDCNDDFSTDFSFMTNADAPFIAVNNVIDNPINPFTGKVISNEDKYNIQYVTMSREYDPRINCGTKFMPSIWYTVHDNIFDVDNWEKIGTY